MTGKEDAGATTTEAPDSSTGSNSLSCVLSFPHQLKDCRFIRLGYHSKIPARGQKGHFKSDSCNYGIDDQVLIQHIDEGNNYGVIPRNGICIIDCDSSELWDRIPALWKGSFVVRSGKASGEGRHIYLKCQDAPTGAKIIFPGSLGDVRLSDSPFYVVGPGSIHPDSGRQYTHNGNEIIEVSWSELHTFIEANKGAVKKSKTQNESEKKIISARNRRRSGDSLIAEACNLKPEDWIMPTNPKYVGNTIIGGNPITGSTSKQNLHIDTAKSVFFSFHNWDGVNKKGGDGLHAFCIAKGLIDFDDLGPGCLDNIWPDVLQALEDAGFDLSNTGMDTSIAKEFMKFLSEREAVHAR